jgi:NAD(P)-dependent dehydrogenase (short-subunit alcohol dehydrogenase family)
MAAAAVERFGGIDFLVNNAAIFGGMKLDFLLTVDWDYLERFLAVNLTGALVCTRACYRSMSERGGGAIVNQSSTAAYLYAGLLRLGQSGGQLAHPAAGPRAREHEHQGERHRTGPDRHRGGPVGGARFLHEASWWAPWL